MKAEQKLQLLTLSKKLRSGDKQLIADLLGYSKMHVTDIFNGKRESSKAAPLIIYAAELLLETRGEFIRKLENELKTKKNR